MKLIVDTNIILKALIKKSKVRALILSPTHQFYLPEYAVEEVEKHLPLIIEKTGLTKDEIKLSLSIILTNIQIIPLDSVLARWGEAEEIMGRIDEGDVPFIAATLSIGCDGIWSDDKDFKRQKREGSGAPRR